MACPTENDAQPPEEKDFQQLVCQIGGKERIYLVSDACKTDEEDEAGILQEFVHEMFFMSGDSVNNKKDTNKETNNKDTNKDTNGQVHPAESGLENKNNCHCETECDMSAGPEDLGLRTNKAEEDKSLQPLNGSVQRTKTSTMNSCGLKRTIDSPIIIFVFSQDFVRGGSNEVCLKGILKDVRGRTRRARMRPALLGLIRSGVASKESRECVGLLERAMRSVFRKHAPDAIWTGHFIPQAEEGMLDIKRNACRALYSSQTSDGDGGKLNYWPFQCLPWSRSGGQRGQDNSTAERPGDTGSLEKGIPLKTYLSSGPPSQEGQTGQPSVINPPSAHPPPSL